MSKTIYTTFFLAFALIMNAQSEQTLFNNSGLELTGIWGGNTSNINENQDDYGVFHGGFFQLEFNQDYTIGWQGYGLNDQDLEMDFNGVTFGYAIDSYRTFHPTFSVFAGGGKFKTQDERRIKDDVFAIQPSLGLEINVARWFRLGLEGGYRFVFDTDIPGYNDTDVSEPFLGLRMKFGFSWGN